MKKKGLRLSDFSHETQDMLREFGISEDLDIAEDFENFMKETYGSDINVGELIERRISEFEKTINYAERLINEMR